MHNKERYAVRKKHLQMPCERKGRCGNRVVKELESSGWMASGVVNVLANLLLSRIFHWRD